MVLGFLRRRRPGAGQGARTGPRGQLTPEGYIPTPEELQAAEPLPPIWEWEDPLDVLSAEEYGWVLVNKDAWRPRGRKGVVAAILKEPVHLEGYTWPHHAMAWRPEGKIYLLDMASYALLHDSKKGLTARELVEAVAQEYIEKLPDGNPLKMAAMKEEPSQEEKEMLWGLAASLYAQLAILRKYGLLT